MSTLDSVNELLLEIAKAADLCLKPWKHAAVIDDKNPYEQNLDNDFSEIILRVECRDLNGQRQSHNDLEIEIFRSGVELNIILAWYEFPLRPILWQGKHSLWMDAKSGKRATVPNGGDQLEAFARRLRAAVSEFF
tara:strand:+ start:3780 stop:4184 length:405 start_codon:yes stop_codon:yes gene_type:complete